MLIYRKPGTFLFFISHRTSLQIIICLVLPAKNMNWLKLADPNNFNNRQHLYEYVRNVWFTLVLIVNLC